MQLGGYCGSWTTAIWCRYLPRVMHVFEPVPRFYRDLVRNTQACFGVSTYPFGLLDENAFYRIGLDEDGSSFFIDYPQSIVVPVRDVHEAFQELSIGQINLLCLNIEGSEFRVLARLLDTGWMPHIDQLFVQYHKSYSAIGEELRSQISRRLVETHELVWGYDWIWELWRLKPRHCALRGFNVNPFVPVVTEPAVAPLESSD